MGLPPSRSSYGAGGAQQNRGPQNPFENNEPPPAYTARQSEIYQGDGDFNLPDGKPKWLPDESARREYMESVGMNTKFIGPVDAEAGLIVNKKPIFVIDSSGSMNAQATRSEIQTVFETKRKGWRRKKTEVETKKEVLIREPRYLEQQKNILRLMRKTDAYSSRPPALWDLHQGNPAINDPKPQTHLEYPQVNVSSVSPEVYNVLSAQNMTSWTPLGEVLAQIKDYESKTSDVHDIAIYISSDGDPQSAGETIEMGRKKFEKIARDLTENGIDVLTPAGLHNRKVAISFQYIGDDDEEYKFKKPYTYPKNNSEIVNHLPPRVIRRPLDPDAYYKARLDDVRRNGSTVAWLNALDNANKGGLNHFDVVDDDEAEKLEIRRKTGLKISNDDLDLKRAVAPFSQKLDRMDESADSDDGTQRYGR